MAEGVGQRELLLQFREIAHKSSPHDGEIESDEMLVRRDDPQQIQLVAEERLMIAGFELIHVLVDHAEYETWLRREKW